LDLQRSDRRTCEDFFEADLRWVCDLLGSSSSEIDQLVLLEQVLTEAPGRLMKEGMDAAVRSILEKRVSQSEFAAINSNS
jgi:hypothetical protein